VSHCAVVAGTSNSRMSSGRATLMIVSLRMTTNAEPTSSAMRRPARSVLGVGGASVVVVTVRDNAAGRALVPTRHSDHSHAAGTGSFRGSARLPTAAAIASAPARSQADV